MFKEGEDSDYVYIVIKGDFELIKKVKQTNYKEINYKKYINSNIFDTGKLDYSMAKSEVDPKVAKFTKNKTLSNNIEYNQNYQVAILSKGQMFGDQDAFFERPYNTTVI